MVEFESITSDMNDAALPFKQLATNLITHFVTKQDHIRIETETSGNGSHVYLAVKGHPDDQGLLIGKDGNNARAMQAILGMAAFTMNRTISYRILEPEDGQRTELNGFKPNMDWTAEMTEEIRKLLVETVQSITETKFEIKLVYEPAGDIFVIAVPDKTFPISVENALNTIFRAIGRKSGRRVCVNVKRTVQQVSVSDADKASAGRRA